MSRRLAATILALIWAFLALLVVGVGIDTLVAKFSANLVEIANVTIFSGLEVQLKVAIADFMGLVKIYASLSKVVSIRPSVHRSVGSTVRPYVCPLLFFKQQICPFLRVKSHQTTS